MIIGFTTLYGKTMDENNKQGKYEKALEYEIFTKEEYGFAKDKIKNAECIFDIGGHIGYFSQRCRSLNSKAEIHYFEPVGNLYNQATTNLGNDKNIIFNNYGISSKTENGTILINQEKTMQSSKYSSFLNPKGSEIGVNFISLKDYLEQRNIDKIDILKMDIEGMEFEVLNSRGEFERGKINNLIAEIHLLNESMKSERNKIFPDIKKRFGNIEIINSHYRNEIFLIRTYKNSK